MNGLSLLVLIVVLAAIPVAFRAGMLRGERDLRSRPRETGAPMMQFDADASGRSTVPTSDPQSSASAADQRAAATLERARLIRVGEREASSLRVALRTADGAVTQLQTFAEDRRRLMRELAHAREETARYREIVVDLEDDALPPLLDVANAPDDLKLIVGIGPVLERMLQRLGIGSYRQIARWGDHDIDIFDAKLPEFHGRIRRDGWVTQARALHQSKYGERAY